MKAHMILKIGEVIEKQGNQVLNIQMQTILWNMQQITGEHLCMISM